VYAFIYNPVPNQFSYASDELSSLEENWVFVAIGCILASVVVVYLVYYLSRQMRYRKKYKDAQKKLEEKKIELERMQTVGANASNIGTNKNLQMERSPLQLQIADINALQAQLPPDEQRLAMYKQEEDVKAKRALYIMKLEEERKQLEEIVQNLKAELQAGNLSQPGLESLSTL
jgi:vacuolar-type H+-ATPase subunit I/STV1